MTRDNLHKQLTLLDTALTEAVFKTNLPIGLADGQLGMCIYFYYLSRYFDEKYKAIAENLLENVYIGCGKTKSIDPKNGLPSIGLGISYLIESGYVKGDPNIVLRDIDNYIFLHLTSSSNNKSLSASNIVYLLIYLTIRLKSQKSNTESRYFLNELIIHTVNVLYEKIDLIFFEEPPNYKIDYPLPMFLYAFSLVYKTGLYSEKVINILAEFSSKIFSIFPHLHTNKLYLLWGVTSMRLANIPGWNEYIDRLRYFLNVNAALTSELGDKSIFLNDGLPSIYMLLENNQVIFKKRELVTYKKLTIERIKTSRMWSLLIDNPDLFVTKLGLFNGYCGVSMFLRMNYKANLT